MTKLSIKNLCLKKDGKRILDDVSLEFADGKAYALVGPNGAGKSTLAYAVMGLDGYREYSGSITFNNKPIKRLTVSQRAKLGITLAWQEPARFQGLKVADYLKASAGRDTEIISESMVKVGLSPEKYLSRAVDKTLSGGERKRIELASIICMKPKLVILDEPDSGVDVEALEKVIAVVDYLKSIGTTIVVITHNLRILRHCDYAYRVCEGKIIDRSSSGNAAEYFKNKCLSCPRKSKKKGINV